MSEKSRNVTTNETSQMSPAATRYRSRRCASWAEVLDATVASSCSATAIQGCTLETRLIIDQIEKPAATYKAYRSQRSVRGLASGFLNKTRSVSNPHLAHSTLNAAPRRPFARYLLIMFPN